MTFTREILDEFFTGHRINREDATFIFCEILSTCVKVIHESQIRVLDIIDYKYFSGLNQFHLMNKYVLKCVYLTSNAIKNKQEKNENGLADKIISYINENYSDSNLTLTYIADVFHVSAIYVSRAVKNRLNINFIDYLNRLRIQKAKEYLRCPNITIKDIAGKTGYESDKNFIRVFKKYEGITPGTVSYTHLDVYKRQVHYFKDPNITPCIRYFCANG